MSSEKQTRYLSQAVRLEEAVNPHIIRATMIMVSLAILTFISWASVTNINEVARASGEVVPHGYQQVVQHLEGGLIKEILVSEGQVVEKDQVLVRLDGANIQSDLNRARSRQEALLMEEERLRAYIEAREPDFSVFKNKSDVGDKEKFFSGMQSARDTERQIIKDQVAQKQQSIQTLRMQLETAQRNYEIIKVVYERWKKLHAEGNASDMKMLENERQLNEVSGQVQSIKSQIGVAGGEIKEYQARLASLSARYLDEANEKLDQVLDDKAQNTEIMQNLEGRMTHLAIRAPVRGLVKGLAVNTVGAVVQPGQTLMEVVPLDEKLEVIVRISPQYIGQLKPGGSVNVKFSTFDFSRYGSVPGELQKISATTFSGDNGERYYQGTILLSRNYVGHDEGNLVIPGMTVMADIVTGEKTILEYLLKPVSRALTTAFTER
jgi:membrane fusion protein, adhesin transport system